MALEVEAGLRQRGLLPVDIDDVPTLESVGRLEPDVIRAAATGEASDGRSAARSDTARRAAGGARATALAGGAGLGVIAPDRVELVNRGEEHVDQLRVEVSKGAPSATGVPFELPISPSRT